MNDDLMDRLRAANPVPDELPAPPPPRLPAHRRRSRRPLALAFAGVAALAAVVLGTAPNTDVVAQAREALRTDDQIIHTVTTTREDDGRTIHSERWIAFDPLREHARVSFSGTRAEIAYANKSMQIKLDDGKVETRAIAGVEEALTNPTPASAGGDPVAGINAMLADGRLHADGTTRVNGRAVVRLAGHQDGAPGEDHSRIPALDVTYLVDAKTYEPVQVTLNREDVGTEVTTFETFERLPFDAKLLALG